MVKVFNNIYFKHLGALARPAGAPDRTALPIAGDDADAKAAVAAFLDAIGYDAVDAGPLAAGRAFQAGSAAAYGHRTVRSTIRPVRRPARRRSGPRWRPVPEHRRPRRARLPIGPGSSIRPGTALVPRLPWGSRPSRRRARRKGYVMRGNRRPATDLRDPATGDVELNPVFARPGEATQLPRFALPPGESLPETAYQIVHDEAMLDGNARLNLATFVGTWMDEQSTRLYALSFEKNMVDKDEYPQTAAIESRCWTMLADLWHAPDPHAAIGTSTIGSSEACMLGGLTMKRRWQHARRAAGRPTDRPNLVMSSAVQVCWEKFCNYFDVEPRFVPISLDHKVLDGHDLASYVDENTIGVVAIMGVTYTGMYEPVAQIAEALDRIEDVDRPRHPDPRRRCVRRDGRTVPAAGSRVGFPDRARGVHQHIRPQVRSRLPRPRLDRLARQGSRTGRPDLRRELPRRRHADARPELLPARALRCCCSTTCFCGSVMTVSARCNRQPRTSHTTSPTEIAKIQALALWNDGSDIPVFAWRLRDGHTANWNLYHLSDKLRMKGWLVPAYPMPAGLADITVQRVVVRNGLSHDLAEALITDIRTAIAYLDALTGPMPPADEQPGFHH